MDLFKYQKDQLYCEGVSVAKVAREVGTPFYLYSYGTLARHYDVFDQAFARLDHLICFAMKANSNIAILRAIAQKGGGVDIVTGGELFRAITARVPTDRIVYSGVGKSAEEIAYALKSKILMFNVESAEELSLINQVARRLKKKAPVALRINPNVDPKTHPYISTGLKKSKFGIQIAEAKRLYAAAKSYPAVRFIGVDCHIGSQITTLSPFVDAMKKVAQFIGEIRKMGHQIDYLDIGGGLGISYQNETPPSPAAYGKALHKILQELQVTVILEPGRVIAGNAGIFVTKALYNKRQGQKNFLVIDGAMNDLLRPSLYGSYHEIRPVRKNRRKKAKFDVVGPICESGDFLAQDRQLPPFKAGELMAVMSAGAYGFTMASTYNSRPRPPEVLVKGRQFFVIRKGESYRDLPQGEKIPKFLT